MRLLLVAYPRSRKGHASGDARRSLRNRALCPCGELLRSEVARGTRIRRVAAEYLGRGDLVPDELVFDMLSAPLLAAADNGGYVLDGFPRTLRQAEVAYSVAQEIDGIELQAVIYLRVGRDELRKRIRARATQEQRSDDDEMKVDHRFEVFETQTEPLLRLVPFYAERGILVDINGEQAVGEVFGDITRAVDSLHI